MMSNIPDMKSVGVREFREKLSELLLSSEPIAVQKHGLTVGFYIPTHQGASTADKEALKRASERLQELMEAQGLDVEDLIQDFKEMRNQDRSTNKSQKNNA